MPIFNASVTGEGGGQGGGDKVTALVGSNASGIDVGDKVILNYPATYDINYTSGSSINYPYYFDGYFLYASGGIFATDGAGSLTYLGNSGSLSGSWGSGSYHIYFPPTYTSNGICFGYGHTRSGVSYFGLMFFSSGAYTGAFNGNAGSGNRSLLLDARLDSSNTGFASLMSLVDYNNYEARLVYVTNGFVTGRVDNSYFPFFTENGDCYAANWSTDKFYKATYNGSAITFTELGSSGIVEAMFGAATNEYTYRAVQSSRKDDYQFWYHAGNSIKGFTHIDTTNNTIAQVTTPSALDAVKGTVFAAWWDLDNRLFIRTSTGLFVFAYTNHDISTMQLVKKFEWSTDYSGPATCSNDLKSYAVGNNTYVKVVREADMPIYEFSANVYNGQNFAGTSLTGFVNEAITTDPYGQSIVEVNTFKDPNDPWTNVGTPLGFDVSTTSSDVSVGWGYYNSGSAEVIIPATVTKTIAQIGTNQTLGYKNDIYVYRDTSDVCSDLMCKTGTTPVGTFKVSTALTTPVYLSPDKTAIAGTNADRGFAVSYEAEHATQTNYTVVGSPTIDSNYVASGFSDSKYLTATNVLNNASGSFELVTAIKMTTASSTALGIIDTGTNSSYNIRLTSSSTNTARLRISTNGSTTSTVDITGSTVLTVGTKFFIKVTYNSSSGYALYTSTDGETWTTEGTSSVTTRPYSSSTSNLLIGKNSASGYCLTGSIYLADTYIKVNGSMALKLVNFATNGSITVSEGYSYIDETDAPYYLGSDLTRSATQMVVHPEDFVEQTDYTSHFNVFGSPTIVDRVASNFSNDNYLVLPEAFTPSSSTWEIRMKVTTGDSVTSTHCYYFSNLDTASNSLVLGTDPTGKFYFYVSSTGSSWNIASAVGTYVAQPNTTYYIKFSFTGSVYKLEVSTDGENWTTSGSVTSSSSVYQNGLYYLGAGFGKSAGNQWPGSIDLSECYIKVGNDIWWSAYTTETTKQGTLFLTQPTAGTTSSVVSANATPTATYVGSVVDPIDMGKTVTMDTTLTKIIDVS